MAQIGRPGLSRQQKQELWARWKAGQSLSDIGRSLGKHAGSIFGALASTGGMAPAAKRRSSRSLSMFEREEISRGLIAGLSLRRIAAQLGRAPSTISREVRRNDGSGKYRAATADERAWRLASRPKQCRLAVNPWLQVEVAQKLRDNWSPQQISGWLKIEYIDDPKMRVSHETIYKSLFVQVTLGLELNDLALEPRNLELLRLHLSVAGEGMLGILSELLRPIPQLRLMHPKVLRRLRVRHASLSDQAHSLKLELPRKLPTLHGPPPVPLSHQTWCLRNRVQATSRTLPETDWTVSVKTRCIKSAAIRLISNSEVIQTLWVECGCGGHRTARPIRLQQQWAQPSPI